MLDDQAGNQPRRVSPRVRRAEPGPHARVGQPLVPLRARLDPLKRAVLRCKARTFAMPWLLTSIGGRGSPYVGDLCSTDSVKPSCAARSTRPSSCPPQLSTHSRDRELAGLEVDDHATASQRVASEYTVERLQRGTGLQFMQPYPRAS
jgi:hypothetical protein